MRFFMLAFVLSSILVTTSSSSAFNYRKWEVGLGALPQANFSMTILGPALGEIPPYLGPEDKVQSLENFVAAFLSETDPLSNQTFGYARSKQATHYIFSGYIMPKDGVSMNAAFAWPDSLVLYAVTKSGKFKADYILGHTQCLRDRTPVEGYYYLGGKIYWIFPLPQKDQAGPPGPFSNFLVESPAHPRCRIVILLSRKVKESDIINWELGKLPRSSS